MAGVHLDSVYMTSLNGEVVFRLEVIRYGDSSSAGAVDKVYASTEGSDTERQGNRQAAVVGQRTLAPVTLSVRTMDFTTMRRMQEFRGDLFVFRHPNGDMFLCVLNNVQVEFDARYQEDQSFQVSVSLNRSSDPITF